MSFNLLKRQTDGAIVPATDEDKECLDRVERGEVFVCKRVAKRNIKLHRKFFGLVGIAFENLPEQYQFANADHLREELIIASGFYEIRKNFNGVERKVAKSVSFDSMPSDDEFEILYNRVLDLVCRLLSIDQPDILEELLNRGFI
jgi:hypothetical protein